MILRNVTVERSSTSETGGCEMPVWAQIVVALAAPSGVLVALIERTRRENNRDHASNASLLRQIDSKVDHVTERVDGHIEWHLDRKEK